MRRAAAVGLLILSVLLGACAGGAGSAGDAGIRGLVTFGPTCPVQSAVSPCPDRPLADMRVQVLHEGDVVADLQSGDDGTFTVPLDPGDYQVRAIIEPGGPGMFAKPVDVRVTQHAFANVTVMVDTGIRTPTAG